FSSSGNVRCGIIGGRMRRYWKMSIILGCLLLANAQAQRTNNGLKDLAKSSLSKIDGELTVSGLRNPVQVLRDEWGIPHIYAQNTDDLFFAQGFVMAQDRLWQMDTWRRVHQGRLSEVAGPAAIQADRLARMTMYR